MTPLVVSLLVAVAPPDSDKGAAAPDYELGWTEVPDPVAPPPDADAKDLLVTEVALGAAFGFSTTDYRALDRQLGGPPLARWNWTSLGVSGELWIDRNVPGFDFLLYRNGGDRDDDTGGIDVNLMQTQISFGRAVVHTPGGLSLVPRAGLGLWDMQVRRWGGPDGGRAGDSELADVSTLRKGGAYADLGVAFTHLFAFGPRDKLGVASGIRIGLRLGANVQILNFPGRDGEIWNSEGRSVTGVQDVRIDGAYARLIVAPSFLHRSERPPKSAKRRRKAARRRR